MSYFGRENNWNVIFVLLDLIWKKVDVAVEEVRVDVVYDFLHRLSRSSDCSVQASEGDHLVFVIGEGSSGVAIYYDVVNFIMIFSVRGLPRPAL